MPAPSASSSPEDPARDDAYDALVASVEKRFGSLTEKHRRRPHLFTTSTPDLYQLFLTALPPSLRQHNTCHTCRRFLERYGSAVFVAADGRTDPAFWDPAAAPEPYVESIRALADAVSRAPIEGVLLSSEKTWGSPLTGAWNHLAVTPAEALVLKPSPIKSTSQLIAEKLQDYGTLVRGLEEFPLQIVSKAHSLLTTGALYRSEKCIGVAKWLIEIHEQRKGARGSLAKESLTWLAVASAPSGFCHVKSTMIGTLLEDLTADLPFAQIKARFDAKMDPLQYQRPMAAPTAGNIAQAEKIIEKLRTAGSLERRFAKLEDIQTLWRPTLSRREPEKKGVFSHLKAAKPSSSSADVDAPPVIMTWEKFARTALPTAQSIEFFIPASSHSYMALVTAKNPDAPPIIQWDSEEKRNPVTWYFYPKGSFPERWNLKSGVYHPVTAVALQPTMWDEKKSFGHQGKKAFFLLEGAWDKEYHSGAGFFPEFLKSEYHEIRATIEAYATSAVVEGKEEATACGIGLQDGVTTWNHMFRVTSKDGLRVIYKLDRWD